MASTKPVPSFSLTSSEAKKIHLGLCLHQHPLSIISTQHPSSPACSPGTWHQDSNQVLWIFSLIYSLWIRLSWTQHPFLPSEASSGHFAAMPRLQQKPMLPHWPQKNQSSSCAHGVEVSQEMPTPAGSWTPELSPPAAHTSGGSKDTHGFAVPG